MAAGTGRIAELREMRAGRVDMKGKALPGYKNNVVAIDKELERLERDGDEAALHG